MQQLIELWSSEDLNETEGLTEILYSRTGKVLQRCPVDWTEDVVVPEGVTRIEDCAFEHCRHIKSIKLPSTLKKIGASAFQSCTSLTDIVIPPSVERIRAGAFSQCRSLEYIEIPEGIEAILCGVFNYCTSLKEVKLPSTLQKIRAMGFYQCESLERINIPDSINIIEDCAFAGCDSLKKIVLPENMEHINDNLCELSKLIVQVGRTQYLKNNKRGGKQWKIWKKVKDVELGIYYIQLRLVNYEDGSTGYEMDVRDINTHDLRHYVYVSLPEGTTEDEAIAQFEELVKEYE